MDRHGCVVLVTGAAAGIGAAIAGTFAQAGARVVLTDIDAKRVHALAARLRAHGREVIAVAADAAVQTEAQAMIDTAVRHYSALDVLVNNAGVMDQFVPLADLDDDHWHHVLAVNLRGPMVAARQALPGMLARGSGVIINIASLGGLLGGRAGTAYTVSKHALIGLTRSIAWQYGPQGIRSIASGLRGTAHRPTGRHQSVHERQTACQWQYAAAR